MKRSDRDTGDAHTLRMACPSQRNLSALRPIPIAPHLRYHASREYQFGVFHRKSRRLTRGRLECRPTETRILNLARPRPLRYDANT